MPRERYSYEQQVFYRRYLQSPQWRAKKEARIEKAGRRCEWAVHDYATRTVTRCERTRYLCVHHNNYERLGAEYDGDLDVYCWFHHMLEHLLWKRCAMCTEPCLENDVNGEVWLTGVLLAMGIDLDVGPVDWKKLPNKEVLLDQVPARCPGCAHYLRKDD